MCECFSVGLIYHQFNKMQNIGGALEQWCSGAVLVSCCCWMSPCRGLVISYNQSSQSSQEAPKLASVGWRMCGRWRGTQFGIYKTQTIHHLHIDYFPLHLQPMWSVSYYVPRPGAASRHTNGNTERVSAQCGLHCICLISNIPCDELTFNTFLDTSQILWDGI